MDDYDYIIGLENEEFLEDGGFVIIVDENVSETHTMVMYGPKTGVIAYGTFLSAVGLFLDMVIIVALLKLVQNVKGTNRLLLGLLIIIQVVALTLVVPLEIAREYLGKWHLGKCTCQTWTILGHACLPAMLWVCVAIALDRICYLRRLDVYSSRHNGYKTPCLIITVTVFSVISVAPLICWMATEEFILEEVCAVLVDKVYTPVLTSLCYFVPATICIVMNIALSLATTKKIQSLRRMDRQESQTALDPKSRCGIHSRSCRMAHGVESYVSAISNSRWSTIAISSSFIILWAPFYIINLKIPFCEGFCIDPRLWSLLQWVGYSCYIACPCLYFMDRRLAETVKSWVNGVVPEPEPIYKSSTESDYSSRSGC